MRATGSAPVDVGEHGHQRVVELVEPVGVRSHVEPGGVGSGPVVRFGLRPVVGRPVQVGDRGRGAAQARQRVRLRGGP